MAKKLTHILPALTLLLLAGTSGAAQAHDRDRNYNHHDHGNKHGRYEQRWDRHDDDDYRRNKIYLTSYQQSRVQRELRSSYFNMCRNISRPNHYGCMQPGWGRPYQIGYPLPPHAVVWEIPRNAYYHLPRPDRGTRYAWVDKDLLLISERNGTVIDVLLRF